MGMFDRYRPVPPLRCPWCGGLMNDNWQGQDGPCRLFEWVQGERHSRDPGPQARPEYREEAAMAMLPEVFGIYNECEAGHWVEAEGKCVNQTWTETRLRRGDEYCE